MSEINSRIEQRLDAMDGRLHRHGERLASMESELQLHTEEDERRLERFEEYAKEIPGIAAGIGQILVQLRELTEKQQRTEIADAVQEHDLFSI